MFKLSKNETKIIFKRENIQMALKRIKHQRKNIEMNPKDHHQL